MKILYFSSYYDQYLASFYKSNPQFFSLMYNQQLAMMKKDYFSVFGSYTNHAERLGNDAALVVANCEPMQKQWAAENNFTYDQNNWIFEIAIAQIRAFKPDVLFIGGIFNVYGKFLDEIRPYCRKIFGWIACPLPENINLNQVDLILTSVPELVRDFRIKGINSELLPAAFDTDILNGLSKKVKKDIDFSFIGGISVAHSKRIEFLQALVRHTPLELFGYGYNTGSSWKSKLKRLMRPNTVESRYKGEVWGMDMFRTLQRSKVTFNAHIDMALGNRVNMRMYEATGVGTLLLTDRSEKSNVEYFADGKEIVTYTSPMDAAEKVKYYLTNEDERKRIALAGQKRTLEHYNYDTNIKHMLAYFEKYLAL